jgi:hypothetical protein
MGRVQVQQVVDGLVGRGEIIIRGNTPLRLGVSSHRDQVGFGRWIILG